MSQPRVPAICQSCGHVFLSPFPLPIGSKNVIMMNIGTNCPACGESTLAADVFWDEGLRGTIRMAGTSEQLLLAANFIASQLDAGVPPEEVKEEASRKFDFLAKIWAKVPPAQDTGKALWSAVRFLRDVARLFGDITDLLG